jgi:hypothetical protein
MASAKPPQTMTLTSKHERLAGLRPLSPEAARSVAEAWEVRMIPATHLDRELDLWLEALAEK